MLDLTATYPGQVVTTDPNFPQGRPRNAVTPGDGTGTPWEEQLAQDLVGAMQAIVAAGGVTPSGNPDRVGASDIVSAIRAMFAVGCFSVGGSAVSGQRLTLAEEESSGGTFVISSNGIQVPYAGKWRARVTVPVRSSSTIEWATTGVRLRGAAVERLTTADRRGVLNGPSVQVATEIVVDIADPATEVFQVLAYTGEPGETITVSDNGGSLVIDRIG